MVEILTRILAGVGSTVAITGGAFGVGIALGLVIFAGRHSRFAPLRWLTIVVQELLRGIPPLVVLFLVYYVVGSGAILLTEMQAAIIALGLVASAHIAAAYSAGYESVPKGQWDAIAGLGLPRAAYYRKVILPQAVIIAIPPAAAYAINLLKDSAVASIIGVHDIAFSALQLTQQNLNGLLNFSIAGLVYIALSAPIGLAARYVNDRLVTKYAAK